MNVLFLPAVADPHLLFDRPAYVKEINHPSAASDSLQDWIAYDVAFEDTNGDAKLDENDERLLMLSDREGANLRDV